MVYMKTTLNIDESVMNLLRDEAVRRGTSIDALVEAGLRSVLANSAGDEEPPEDLPPLPSWNSGGFLVDISDREELYRVMDGE